MTCTSGSPLKIACQDFKGRITSHFVCFMREKDVFNAGDVIDFATGSLSSNFLMVSNYSLRRFDIVLTTVRCR